MASLEEIQAQVTLSSGGIGKTTDAEADVGNGSLVAILKRLRTLLAGGLPASLGQKAMAASLPVTLASNQNNVPVAVALIPLTPAAPATVAVGVASGQVVAANANRKGLVISNGHATQVLSIAFGATAVLNSGIVIRPGVTWTMTPDTYTTAVVNGIGSGAATTTGVQEFT